MSEIIPVGVDLAKNVLQAHGADAAGRAVLRKKLRRAQVLEFFGHLPPCVVAMEACGGAHFWGCQIRKLGHEVRLGLVHHSDRGSQGGFNRSSQHPDFGGVDDDRKTEVGALDATQIILARSTASLAA